MKEVIRIPETNCKEEKPVKLTHRLEADLPNTGWISGDVDLSEYDRVIYLGHCEVDGDMFAACGASTIEIFKGHLNSGKY